MSPVFLSTREWLIQPEALHAMALAARSFQDRGAALPDARSAAPLLTVEDGIGTVSIEGPILRKPDAFSRILFGATDSEAIGNALSEAGEVSGQSLGTGGLRTGSIHRCVCCP